MKNVDLHIHSYFSDGQISPRAIFKRAKRSNLAAIAITDHNFIAFKTTAPSSISKKNNPELIEGVEISSYDPKSNLSWHILGYSQNFDVERINSALSKTVAGYNRRAKKIISMLNKKYPGINLNYSKLKKENHEAYVSRNTLACKLKKHLKSRASIKEISKLVRVEEDSRWMMTPEEAVKTINYSGGLAVLAHPGRAYSKDPKRVTALVGRLKKIGLAGVEAIYSSHSKEEARNLRFLCRKLDLLISAGSDWHGDEYTPHKPFGMRMPSKEFNKFISAVRSLPIKKGS